jgi:hypothetical protein
MKARLNAGFKETQQSIFEEGKLEDLAKTLQSRMQPKAA